MSTNRSIGALLLDLRARPRRPDRVAVRGQRPDRRTARTRAALLRAFVELLLEQGYDDLTVDVVAARADVGRSTLYAHYGGLRGLLQESLDRPSAPLAGLVDGSVCAEQLKQQLIHFREQRRRNRAFFEDPLRAIWVRRLAELIERRLAPPAPSALALPPAFIALQIAEAQIALVRHWLAARPAPPVEAVAAAMVDLTQALRQALAGGG
jgi:AcrR family transcriptional regulator